MLQGDPLDRYVHSHLQGAVREALGEVNVEDWRAIYVPTPDNTLGLKSGTHRLWMTTQPGLVAVDLTVSANAEAEAWTATLTPWREVRGVKLKSGTNVVDRLKSGRLLQHTVELTITRPAFHETAIKTVHPDTLEFRNTDTRVDDLRAFAQEVVRARAAI